MLALVEISPDIGIPSIKSTQKAGTTNCRARFFNFKIRSSASQFSQTQWFRFDIALTIAAAA
jgi:hypothetical protein